MGSQAFPYETGDIVGYRAGNPEELDVLRALGARGIVTSMLDAAHADRWLFTYEGLGQVVASTRLGPPKPALDPRRLAPWEDLSNYELMLTLLDAGWLW